MKRPSIKKPKLHKPSVKRAFTSRSLLIGLPILLGIGLYGLGSYVWYKDTLTNQDRVFYDMLETNLSTDSVVRTVTQKEGTRDVTQSYYTTYSPEVAVQSLSTLEQVDANREKSRVVTETIGDKQDDYVRYSSINLPASQSQQDFSDVLGQWAKRSSEQSPPQLLNESIFTFFPIGNLSDENKQLLIEQIRSSKVYTINNSELYYQGVRPMMKLSITIKPKELVTILRDYAQLTGVGDQQMLDPTQYERASNVGVDLTVDVLSRHMKEISFPGSSRQETYSAYGLNRQLEVPTDTITLDELQSRIAE